MGKRLCIIVACLIFVTGFFFYAICAVTQVGENAATPTPTPMNSEVVAAVDNALGKFGRLMKFLEGKKAESSDAKMQGALDVCVQAFSESAKTWLENSKQSIWANDMNEPKMSMSFTMNEEGACIRNVNDLAFSQVELTKEISARLNSDTLLPLNEAYTIAKALYKN